MKSYNPWCIVKSKAATENNAESGTAVLVDVRTGEVISHAKLAPSYNPNNLANVKDELKRNRAITDTFEPGSTVKTFRCVDRTSTW